MGCDRCGALNPADAPFCAACGASLKSAGPVVQPDPIAGLGGRFLAVILDTALMGVVFAVAGMWGAARWGGLTDSGFAMEGAPALAPILGALVFGFLYYWLSEGVFGATLGKGIVGISVRCEDGRACTLAASLIRNLLRVIDGLAIYAVGFLAAVLSRSRQRLGDRVAETVVVRRSAGALVRVALVLAWALLCAGGLTASYWVHHHALQSTGALSAPCTTAGTTSLTEV